MIQDYSTYLPSEPKVKIFLLILEQKQGNDQLITQNQKLINAEVYRNTTVNLYSLSDRVVIKINMAAM